MHEGSINYDTDIAESMSNEELKQIIRILIAK